MTRIDDTDSAAELKIMDAAMGTRLIARGLDLTTDDPCLWNLSHPDEVSAIHSADLAAGAGLICTNTFGANRHWLDRLGRSGDFHGINQRAVQLAQDAIRGTHKTAKNGPSKPKIVGDLGPTALFDEMTIRSQIAILFESGVDFILLETLSAELVPHVIEWLPASDREKLWASFWNWGDCPADTAQMISDAGVQGWGTNCISDADKIVAIHRQLHSAGVPAQMARPSAMPIEQLRDLPERLRTTGLKYLGGCCGTDHHTIAMWRDGFIKPRTQ